MTLQTTITITEGVTEIASVTRTCIQPQVSSEMVLFSTDCAAVSACEKLEEHFALKEAREGFGKALHSAEELLARFQAEDAARELSKQIA